MNGFDVVSKILASFDILQRGKKVKADKEVNVSQMDDASVTAQIKSALLLHQSLNANKITATTKDGVAMVTGEAASESEKRMVSRLLSDIKGVKAVQNELTTGWQI